MYDDDGAWNPRLHATRGDVVRAKARRRMALDALRSGTPIEYRPTSPDVASALAAYRAGIGACENCGDAPLGCDACAPGDAKN